MNAEKFYSFVVRHPWAVIVTVVLLTAYFIAQLPKLEWETDARVYLPKGHPAIIYDEKVEDVFGVKDSIIIGIVNEEKGIFNPTTLERIAAITEQVAGLPGVIANRTIDVTSLSTESVFVGTKTEVGSQRLMEEVPETRAEIERLKEQVYDNSDLLVGNIVSADGKAAMIRAKLKEGKEYRYRTYFEIKGLLARYGGQWQGQGWQGGGGQQWNSQQWQDKDSGKQWQGAAGGTAEENGDEFYIAGRPAIEVTSGLFALQDLAVMAPLLVVVMVVMLFIIFRTGRGVALPIFVMFAAIIWTMGLRAALGIPMFTISTMLPVILAAVGIGDAIHLLSDYYDNTLENPHRKGSEIILQSLTKLGAPLLITTLTTAAGFLALLFAEMPPFRIFGVFTVLGVVFCWFLTITFIPAVLSLMRPKVGGYLQKRKKLRVHNEQGWCSRHLVGIGDNINRHRAVWGFAIAVVTAASLYGGSKLFVDSSWMSDFRDDSQIVKANDLLNEKFDGTIFLNVVIEGEEKDLLKSPEILSRIEGMQEVVEEDPYVGDSLSIVDYLKSMNKTFHAGDEAYNVLPESKERIAEFLFLFSISGRPAQLDEVVDFDFRRANVMFHVKTDHTRLLKRIIDDVEHYVDDNFADMPVQVNLAGSGNNSYVWADLLIDSQTTAIVVSKLAILIIAVLLFRSLLTGLFTVIPVTLTTLIVAGVAGFAAIPLDVSTALAAGLAIGVGVDYTVHYMHRYWYQRRHGADHRAATAATMRSVGKTITYNAIIVAVGFSVLLLSQFPPHVKLGNFVAAYMLLSLMAALMVLPILLSFQRLSARHR